MRSGPLLALGIVAVVALLLPPFAPAHPWQATFATVAVSLVMESLPFLILGALIGGLVEIVLPDGLLPRLARRAGWFGLPLAAGAGMLLPTCECAVVGVARGLVRKGLPGPLAVAWMLAAPTVSPTVAASTWVAFATPEHALLRIGGGLFVACLAGWILGRWLGAGVLRAGAAPPPTISLAGAVRWTPVTIAAPAVTAVPGASHRHSWRDLLPHAGDHLLAMLGPFVIGVLCAAAVKTFLPLPTLDAVAGNDLLAPAALMTMAVSLSLCAEADAFVCASFTAFPLHAHIGFLVLGPMLDLKLLVMWRSLYSDRGIALIAGLAVTGTAIWVALVWALGSS